MDRVFYVVIALLMLASRGSGYYFFDIVGCHVYESTGMCGWCDGGCWPYWSNNRIPCHYFCHYDMTLVSSCGAIGRGICRNFSKYQIG